MIPSAIELSGQTVNALHFSNGSPAFSAVFGLPPSEKESFKYGGKCLWSQDGEPCSAVIVWTEKRLHNLEQHIKTHDRKKKDKDDEEEVVEAEGLV